MGSPRVIRHGTSAVVIALLAGCATIPTSVTVSSGQYRAYTSGVIGCPAEEITISGERSTLTAADFPMTWRAACRGHQFICSHGGGKGDSARCAEELKQAPASPAPARP
jgi:uncharacterized protein YceK